MWVSHGLLVSIAVSHAGDCGCESRLSFEKHFFFRKSFMRKDILQYTMNQVTKYMDNIVCEHPQIYH